MSRITLTLVVFLSALFAALLTAYFIALDEPISSVKSTRPILVFTLIVAMLGFGGMLMAKSLFGSGNNEDFTLRFRHAREIFLVYSGIFGTIIGFYFGAADAPDLTTGPSAAVTFRSLESGHEISAQISGGTPPFTAYLQQGDPKLGVVLAGDDRLLKATLEQSAPCPDQAELILVDGRGRRGTSKISAGDLKGWNGTRCSAMEDGTDGTAGSSNATTPADGAARSGSAAGSANVSGGATPPP